MKGTTISGGRRRPSRRRALARRRSLAVSAAAGVLALVGAAAPGAFAETPPAPSTPGGVTAAMEQCVTSDVQSERSATFMGEMTAIAGTAKMAIRIDVEERAPEELEYHTISAPGLGVWRAADPKVKVYKYLKQVTNLSAPASYRALVRFRWINSKGHVVRRVDRLTTRCLQPAPPAEATTQPTTTQPPGGGATTPPAQGTPSG